MKCFVFILPLVMATETLCLGATMCIGPIDGNSWMDGTDGKHYVCFKDYANNVMLYPDNGNYDYVCVYYETTKPFDMMDVGDIIVLDQCDISRPTYACAYDNYYTNSGCVGCPSGKVATAGENGHTKTSCSMCKRGYYNNGAYCATCPEDGYSSYGTTAITGCYKSRYTTGSDATGNFTYTSDCYYSL